MNLVFKLGIIEKGRTIAPDNPTPLQPRSSSCFQVRVLPEMANIEDTDPLSGEKILPWYPNFFGDSLTSYDVGELVWIAVEETTFRTGFVLGYAQSVKGNDITTFAQRINWAERVAGIDDDKLSGIGELAIQKIDNKCLTCVNRTNGRVINIYNNKIIYLFNEDGSIFTTNGSTYSAVITPEGDITFTGKSKTETIKGEVKETGGKNSENYTSKKISTSGGMSINAGGGYQLSSGGKMNINSVGGITTVGSKISNTSAFSTENTVGLGTYSTTVGAGIYQITVIAGVVNITAPMISMEAPVINLIGIVNVVGALNCLLAPWVQLPINPAIGWGTAVPMVVSPTLIGI